jgi:phospholipid/cholesterol/gamma-HCH transport system substrate-binding protein
MWQKKWDIYLAIEEESVAGLNVNAPVKYNGVEVGKVRSIALDPQDPQRVNLYLAIERGSPIKQDTVAVLKAQGLTGITYVELSGGARGSVPLTALPGAQYPIIATKSSLSTRLENVLTRVLAKLDSTTGNVDAFVSEKNQLAFSSTLANIARASAQLPATLSRVGNSAEAIAKMGDTVNETSLAAGHTVNAIGTDIKRFSAETLPELERLLGELSVLSASLRRLSEQAERAPSGLVFGHAPVRPGPGEAAQGEAKP